MKPSWKPRPAQVLNPNKQYVICSNCGLFIESHLIAHHYKFCAMTTPPSDQPYRND